MIIAITGTLGAGKNTVVDILKEQGFKHFSIRDYLIEEIKKRNLEINRDSMVEVATEIRKANGREYITKQLYEKAKGQNSVIESIRQPKEVEFLKSKNIKLIAVDADLETRYKRIKERKSETDNISFEKFKHDEEREMQSNDPYKQQLRECINLADYKIENNESIEQLKTKIIKLLKTLNYL
jgi:dephospho-CoA kinase